MRISIVRTSMSAALVLLLGMVSCSDSENRHLALLNQAKVIIDLGMPEDEDTSSVSIIDRVFRFFVRDAVAQTVPARLSSISVRITGPNFTPIEKTFTAYGDLSINVPAGSLRHFEVIATVSPATLSAARSFRGTATINLPAGATVNVPVLMGIYETKLVIPDRGRNRLYILNTILDDTPTIINTIKLDVLFQGSVPTGWTSAAPMFPNDVDFDARGRIYLCTNQGATSNYIIRIDNEDGASTIIDDFQFEILSIAIDRKRNTLYYGTNDALYYINMTSKATGTVQLPTSPSLSSIRGIAVDEVANYLYLACTNGSYYGILKQNPDNAADYTWLTIPDSPTSDNTFDVMIKRPFVYATWYNTSVAADNGILQIPISNFSSTELSSLTVHGADSFLGPRRFIAKHNRGFMVMDESPTDTSLNRLVGFLTFEGLGWKTYQPPTVLAPFGFY